VRHALVLATGNAHKLKEIRAILSSLPVDVLAPTDVLTRPPTVVEDGATFADNAAKKAVALARATMMLTVGDDSGLEVDALDGAPGVRSARYAHSRATDGENNAALLAALAPFADEPGELRARFRCVLALVDPLASLEPHLVSGVCEGMILTSPRGAAGFGYDPIFLVDGHDKTMAELTDDEKNAVSHRGRAAAALRDTLERALAAREASARGIG
jgi:XTP/dITP diphosphohydrolase